MMRGTSRIRHTPDAPALIALCVTESGGIASFESDELSSAGLGVGSAWPHAFARPRGPALANGCRLVDDPAETCAGLTHKVAEIL